MNDLLGAALKYAAAGTPVHPLTPTKQPMTANGFKDATTDQATIRGWKWDGMIGTPIQDGQVVIDVDPRNGGDATMAALESAGRVLPRTKTARTGGGGSHYYLDVPPALTLRSTLGPGVDVKRAGKGYVVVPPSPGYSWERPIPRAAAPAWLLEELVVTATESAASEPSEPKYVSRFEKGTQYGLRALESEVSALALAGEGGRNNALNKAAFSLAQLAVGGELDAGHATESLMVVAERIGLEEHEARATIESGWNAGADQPRQAPEREATVPRLNAAGAPNAEARRAVASGDDVPYWSDWWSVDEPAPPFYLHGCIPMNAYILVYGATEASKSMVWNGLLAEASRERDLRCSVYSLENPPHTDRDRLRRLRADPVNFRLTNQPLDLAAPGEVEALIAREAAWPDGRSTDLLLIDTYSHAFNSRSDDGNAKAIEFARRVRYIMAEVGCSVIVIDHTGYQQKDEPRDASAKRQQVDVAVLMEKRSEWQPGQPAQFRMTNKKAARFANPFYYQGEIRDTKLDGSAALEIRWEGSERPRWPDA